MTDIIIERIPIGDGYAYRFWRLVYYKSWTNTCGVMLTYRGRRVHATPISKKKWPNTLWWHWIHAKELKS